MKKNILFLTGFSGTGKTTVGRKLANNLRWKFLDIDEELTKDTGQAIKQIFADLGESGFRDLEHNKLLEAVAEDNLVISTGGGILTEPKNLHLMSATGLIICLEATISTIQKRLNSDAATKVRPMLKSDLSTESIVKLKSSRQTLYAQADWTIHTDQLKPDLVATEISRALHLLNKENVPLFEIAPEELSAIVETRTGSYPIWVSNNNLDQLGERLNKVIDTNTAYVITDQGANGYARKAQISIESAGVKAHSLTIEPGEKHKNLVTVELIYKWLAERKAERGHVIVAVGGGVVGDLVGYVAATYLRGISIVHVPTTLLAMMDSSIGGKTGIDLQQGKNLVGSFHQPKFVLVDTNTLETLPERTLTEGWAEGIKHGLALDKSLLEDFEKNIGSLKNLDADITTEIIKKSISIKAGIVSEDEFEKLGRRILLNYGHTIGHAIESVTKYSTYLHGEAVSIGMMAAAHISASKNLLSYGELNRQEMLLQDYGLPTTYKNLSIDKLKTSILSDKKKNHGKINWVLLNEIGKATTTPEVDDRHISKALKNVCSA